MLEFNDRRRCFATHVGNRVLVSEPVRTLDGVIHMPAPIILTHVAQRRAHSPLSRDRVGAGRENLTDACGP